MGGLTFTPSKRTIVTVKNAPPLNPTAALTLSVWIKATDWYGGRHILRKGQAISNTTRNTQYRLQVQNSEMTFQVAGVLNGIVTAPLPMAGAWHHLAGTYDGASVKLYVDGQLVAAEYGTTGAIRTTADDLFIGSRGPGTAFSAGDYFHGVLDEVAIYNRALNATEVGSLAGGTPPL
jgi:hypothetical protein